MFLALTHPLTQHAKTISFACKVDLKRVTFHASEFVLGFCAFKRARALCTLLPSTISANFQQPEQQDTPGHHKMCMAQISYILSIMNHKSVLCFLPALQASFHFKRALRSCSRIMYSMIATQSNVVLILRASRAAVQAAGYKLKLTLECSPQFQELIFEHSSCEGYCRQLGKEAMAPDSLLSNC